MILPHDPPLSAVLSLCADQTLINGPPCQTQILSRAGLRAISPTYCRCARALTQSALHTIRRDTKHTRGGAITHNCMCINICWSITFLFSIHFQPDTKSIDLRDISLSLPAFQSLIYRTQYYIMPKEWRIFPPWCMGQKCKSFYSGFKRLHAAAHWNWALWKKGVSYSKMRFLGDVAADLGSAKCVKMNRSLTEDGSRRSEGDDTWAQPGEKLPSAGHRICPECTARPPPRRQEVRYGRAISNVAKPRITA